MSNLILLFLVVLVMLCALITYLLWRLWVRLGSDDSERALERHVGQTLDQSLGNFGQRVNDSLARHAQDTSQNLGHLREKLGAIEATQLQFQDLSRHMVDLKQVLDNRQARGTMGEMQLFALINQVLPKGMYRQQETLSNQRRVDSIIILPNPPGNICIDAKFPLEGYRDWLDNSTESDQSLRRFRGDVRKHIDDIAARYIIAGETADFALMFIPAEGVYAEIHATLDDLVQYAFKKKVFLVSPSTLMAVLNTLRGIVRDVELVKQTSEVKRLVGLVLEDVRRLEERTAKLKSHYLSMSQDMDLIEKSQQSINTRAEKIMQIDTQE